MDPSSPTAVLLAAGWLAAGWLDVVGPLIAILFLVLQQVLTGKEDADKKTPPLRRPKPPQDGDGPPRPDAPVGAEVAEAPPQDDLRSEVEEFLRRLGEDPQAVDEPEVDEFDDEEPEPPVRRSIDPFEEPPPRQTVKPMAGPTIVIPAPSAPALAAEEPVAEAASSSRLGTLRDRHVVGESSRLGQGVASSDERLEERLHQKFDHRLGKLSSDVAGPSDDAEAEAEPSSASRIKAMLSGPNGVRDAVILSEILRRPGG